MKASHVALIMYPLKHSKMAWPTNKELVLASFLGNICDIYYKNPA